MAAFNICALFRNSYNSQYCFWVSSAEDTQKQYCELYELRNNAHILKAATADYYPKLKEASAAYELTFRFIAEIKAYFTKHQQNK